MTTPTLLQASIRAADALRGINQWLKVRTGGTGLMPDEQQVLEELEKAIEREKAKPSRFDVMVITTAYEQGFGKGLQDRGVFNPYVADSPAFHAWQLGYEEGQMRLKQKEQKP